jgi:hypothetical protein
MEDIEETILADYDISEGDYTKYLLRSLDTESELPILFLEFSKLKKIMKLLQNALEWSGDSLPKLSAIIYSNIIDSGDMNVRLLACQVLLSLCTAPMASAYGIATTFVLKNICGVIQKCLVDVLHGRLSSQSGKKRNLDDEDLGDTPGGDSHGERELQHFEPSILLSLLRDYRTFLPLYSNRTEEYLLELFADTLVSAICLSSVREEYSGRVASPPSSHH